MGAAAAPAPATARWGDILPAISSLPDSPQGSAAEVLVAGPEQPLRLTSPETILDTALILAPHLRSSTKTIAELFPRIPGWVDIVIPSPASKSDGSTPAPPTSISIEASRRLTVSAAAAAAGIPPARLVSSLVQCAVLHSVAQPEPQSDGARRLSGWLAGLAPMDAYLLHTAVLADRVPRAQRVQASGISGRSRAEQLCIFFGSLVAADPELAPLFSRIYTELNPLSSESRSRARIPELAEQLPNGLGWGGTSPAGPTLGHLFGLLHPELDAESGWLLVRHAKKGAPRESWTIGALRETQHDMLAQLSRTGEVSLGELRDKLTKARVPISHADDTERWLDYVGLAVGEDGVVRPAEQDVADGDSSDDALAEPRAQVENVFPGVLPIVLGEWRSFIETSIYPSPAPLTEAQVELISEGSRTPLAQQLGEDRFALYVRLSHLADADFDAVARVLGAGPEPLAELEQLGDPATSLLDALSEALAGPRGAYVAMHLVWAVNRCRGNGSAHAHYSESKNELGSALLLHPATFPDPDPAIGWIEMLRTPWWVDPRSSDAGGPPPIPAAEVLRRRDLEGELSPDVLRAMESAEFRAQIDRRIQDTLAAAAGQAAGPTAASAVTRDVDGAAVPDPGGREGAADASVAAGAAVEAAAAPSGEGNTGAEPELHDLEKELAARLESAPLVAAVTPGQAELDRLRAALEGRFAALDADAEMYTELFERFPAVTLFVLVDTASKHAYAGQEQGASPAEAELGVLPWIAAALGLDDSAADGEAIRALRASLESCLESLLRGFGLETFDEVPSGDVGDVLVAHAAVPEAAMGTVAEVLLEFTNSVADRTIQKARPWLLDPSQREFFLSLPTGTQYLVRYAGESAGEMLEGAIDVVEMFLAGFERADVLAGETVLPRGLCEQLLAALHVPAAEGRALSAMARRAADRAQRPYLWLDGTDAVCVALPPVAKYTDDAWVVTTGDEVTPVRPRRSLRDDETQLSLLGRPTRRVAVTHPSFHAVAELRLFTTDFPVAVFQPDGMHVPTSSMIPEGEVFALVPPGHEPASPEAGGPVVLETLDTPEGWGQWTLQLWSLEGLEEVVVHDAEGVAHGIRVGTRALPSLWDTEDEPLERLTGVESELGVPVLAVRPWLDVPPLEEGQRPWQVAIRRTGDDAGAWYPVGHYDPTDEHEGHALFSDGVLEHFGYSESEPVLGGFDIRIEGPDHARTDIRIFVAEGFYAHFPESPRLPEADGATPAVAELSAEPVGGEDAEDEDASGDGADGAHGAADGRALGISAHTVEFGASTRKLRVQVSAGERTETLVLRPPRLKFRMTGTGMAPAWSDQQISRSAYDLEHATLVVRDPYATLHISLQLVDERGRLTQRADFDRAVDGTFRIDVQRFAERAKTLRKGEIRAVVVDPDAEGTRSYKRVATLVRFGTASEQHITLERKRLRVPGAEGVDDLVCRVWQLERPWKPALSIPVTDGFAPLPAELDGAGRLRVDVAIEDPWDPVPAAALPHRGTTSLQTASRFSNTGQGLLSQFLAGRGAATYVASSLSEVWSAWSLLSLNLHPVTDRPLRTELAGHLRSSPRANLLSLDRSTLTSPQKVAAFIASGLVSEPIAPAPPGGDHWDRSAAGTRRSMSGSTRPRESWIDVFLSIANIGNEPPRLRRATAAHLREVGGDSLHHVLAFGEDPLQSSVRLGLPEVQAAMDPTLRQMLLSRPTIPGPLLDASSRWEGLLALLRNEKAFTSGYVRDQFERMLGKYESLRRFRPLYRLITERIKALPATVEVDKRASKGGRGRGRGAASSSQAVELPMWSNIPQLTFSLALLARGHAYGYFATGLDQDLLDLWARLVAQAPQQIVIDLVLAEAHIAHLRLGGATFLP